MKNIIPLKEKQSIIRKARHDLSVRVSLYVLLGLALYLFMMGNIAPKVVDVSIGSKAEQDIISPITILDEEATERAQEKAAKEIKPVYTQDNSITDNQVRNLDRTFTRIKEIINSEEADTQKREQIKALVSYELPEETYPLFLNYSSSEIETLGAITKSIVHEIMYAGVKEAELEKAIQQVNESLILSSLNSSERIVAREMARASIVPNYVYNEAETEKLRTEAREAVRNVEIREGEVLVSAGEVINAEMYRKLGKVGLLSESANMRPFLGLIILIALLILFLVFYFASSAQSFAQDNKQLFMYVVILLLNVILLKIVNVFQVLGYEGIGFLAPVAFSTMLITMLINQRIAIFSSFIIGILASILLNGESLAHIDFTYGLVAMFSSAAGALFLGKTTRKTSILQAGFVVSAVTVIAIFMAIMLKNIAIGWLELSQYLIYGFLGGLLASVLTIGLMPFFEAAFSILSPMKLIELSNPNHPLLRKILTEAPGTYHHSIMVANLAEAATEAVGGDGLLARVGSYYHDIGKTKRPHFFIENQMGLDNPHDKIAPHLSKTIIIAHVIDGVQMLREHGLPQAIQDIAEQHHGTTLIKYFYHQAKQETDSEVTESEFRYPGRKAQFKESAIVGIADSVEAAVRSLAKPSPERIENMVRTIIRDRLEDGQFDECDLTLKELDLIAKAICETLQGIFHSRIEYPEDKEKGSVKEIASLPKKKNNQEPKVEGK